MPMGVVGEQLALLIPDALPKTLPAAAGHAAALAQLAINLWK
jgi:hypothetical protein